MRINLFPKQYPLRVPHVAGFLIGECMNKNVDTVIGYSFGFLLMIFSVLLLLMLVIFSHDAIVCKQRTGYFQCTTTDNKQQKIEVELK